MERNGPIHPFKTYSNVQQFLAGGKRRQNGHSYTNNASNIGSNKGIRKSKKRIAISEYSDKVEPNKVALRLAKDADEESAIQSSRQEKRQAAEERAEAARQSVQRKKFELLPPLTSNVGKPMNHVGKKAFEQETFEKFIKETNEQIRITRDTIMKLTKQLTEQENSLRSIQSQSYIRSQLSRFTGAPTSEDINREIITISEKINQQSNILADLEKRLNEYKGYLSK